jgi:hypothetical protein
MVVETPTAADFVQASLATFNLAWDIAVDLAERFKIAIEFDKHDETQVSDEYWSLAQRRLGHAVTLIHQGLELALKSRIAKVSPYLLIASDAYSLPKLRPDAIPFSDFKTHDAKDLVRIHDVFCDQRMPEEWTTFFDNNRRLRNKLIHGIGKADRISEIQIFSAILQAIRLMPDLARSWPVVRRQYLQSGRADAAVAVDHYPLASAAIEFDIVTKRLPKNEVAVSLGYDKGSRSYICPGECYSEMQWSNWFSADKLIRLAQLKPNEPGSKFLFCFVCGQTHEIIRSDCREESCPSNAIASIPDEYFGDEDRLLKICLTCGANQNPASPDILIIV